MARHATPGTPAVLPAAPPPAPARAPPPAGAPAPPDARPAGATRNPASLRRVVGLKPTYGRVSRRGVVPLSWALDHVGPLTRTVEDAAIVLGVIAGPDPLDDSASQEPVPDYQRALKDTKLKGLRVGVPREHFFENVDAEVLEAVRRALGVLAKLGADGPEGSLPH